MIIRPYQPPDDDALMELERQSPRGFPKPFVHFRRRFIDRAHLYATNYTLVAETDGQIVGVTSIIVKDTLIGGQRLKVAYSFDTRVHPKYRRNGIGHAMVEEKLKWAQAEGAVGVYSLIVSTNNASLGMVDKSGYQKVRLILYLQYQPYPLIIPPASTPICTTDLTDRNGIEQRYGGRDLYVPHVAERVKTMDFQRWSLCDDNGHEAALSVYNQAYVYAKVPADAPMPRTEDEIERLGRNLQIFDVVGFDHPGLLIQLVDYIRDEAVVSNVNKLTWLVDRQENVPNYLFDNAAQQTDYWLMYKPFDDSVHPNWDGCVYLDPRDL